MPPGRVLTQLNARPFIQPILVEGGEVGRALQARIAKVGVLAQQLLDAAHGYGHLVLIAQLSRRVAPGA